MGPFGAFGVYALVFGLLGAAAGLYGYVGRTAPRFFKDLFFLNGFYLMLPVGTGLACLGASALLWYHHPATDVLLTVGLALIAVGVLLGFWHPRWIRPWWLKDGSTWL